MPEGSRSSRYTNLESNAREEIPWYWRVIALAASWMILAGYLILPGLYAKDPQLKFSQAVLSVFVVGLLTAGYSFTALLCFACHDLVFQAESIFLPALASSALGLLTIAYNFLASRSCVWGTAAISGTVVSCTFTLAYGLLLLWTHSRIIRGVNPPALYEHDVSGHTPSFHANYIRNMFPTAVKGHHQHHSTQTLNMPLIENDPLKPQWTTLLHKTRDAGPSADANSATFHIDLPADDNDTNERVRPANSSELIGFPLQTAAATSRSRERRTGSAASESLSEQSAWGRWQNRGRAVERPSSSRAESSHSRRISREERRREIELGHV